MKLHLLKYFCVLAEELHFGRAADRLAITQSPLSLGIKALEEELGVRLLLRNSKMVQLTPAGAAFLIEARQVLERLSRVKGVVQAVDSGMVGRLEIGMSPSLVYREVRQIVERFKAEMPGVEIVLHEMVINEQFENLTRGQIHAGFANGSVTPPPFKSIPLAPDRYVLCLPADHAKAGEAAIDLRDMVDEQFIMFSRDIGPANHDHMITTFTRAGIHPRTVHKTRTWHTITAMVSEGFGVALVPGSMAKSRMAGVRFIPFSGPSLVASAMLMWNPAQTAPGLASFVESAVRTVKAQKRRA
ncbi:MAG TPA: LysR family transcriptional regulator [Ramlibacter sp.]|nr:LysR family transcriptional regulator [Ramlibacter sp.]